MGFKRKDFIFEEYPHEGNSGRKLLATRKSDGNKFIVKHEDPSAVRNEFVFYSLAKELGINILDFGLFDVMAISLTLKH